MRAFLICSSLIVGCGGANSTASFVGTWNYDFADRSSGLNIANVTFPPPGPSFAFPQIGNLVIVKTGEGTIQGKTDVGCTWNWAVQGSAAMLNPPIQTCIGNAIGASYSLNPYTISLVGNLLK